MLRPPGIGDISALAISWLSLGTFPVDQLVEYFVNIAGTEILITRSVLKLSGGISNRST
jgi:hypothetical protein